MGASDLFLGGIVDPKTGEKTGQNIAYDSSDLTTHGVIVGMTGSGKTGLGVVLLEELLSSNIPTLVIDPKGDMGNLKLRFPNFSPASFEPWLDTAKIQRDGGDVGKVAEETANRWRDGLAGWGLDSSHVRKLCENPVTIYTPGSTAGVPVNVLGSLKAPDGLDWETGAEAARAEIEGTVSGLLGLIDVDADPLSSREHILLTNLIERAWREGRELDIGGLIGQVQTPPIRKLGVFELDTFFPAKDRTAFAMRLNGLVANPSFASWLEGEPLDIQTLLFGTDGKARAPVFYLSHLSEAERQFVVTLLLSKVVTWMQTQSGTQGLRCLIYMDEVFGFVPPTKAPPSKKPILTLLKQARAFGVGLVLSTQNPVDLDYKAMSNAGTWMIGRLQTERDKARILEALKSARPDDGDLDLDAMLSGLGKRQFLLHNTREAAPTVFSTRWAMSYLAGPLTKPQVSELERDSKAAMRAAGPVSSATANSSQDTTTDARKASSQSADVLADDETEIAPEVAPGVEVYYLDPGAEWADEVDAVRGGTRLEAGLCARVSLVFDDTKLKLEERQEYELVLFPLASNPEVNEARTVDYDSRDFVRSAPSRARYVLPEAKVKTKGLFSRVEKDLKNWLYKERTIEVLVNRKLKLVTRPGEKEAGFAARCDKAAQTEADREAAKVQSKLATKLKSIERKENSAERQRDKAKASYDASKTTEVVSGVGSVLSVLLGGRSSTRAIAKRAAQQARSASSRRAASARGRSRVAAADDKLAELASDREELEVETLETIADIDAKWTEIAADIESVEVGLERRDIVVEELKLVWIPTE